MKQNVKTISKLVAFFAVGLVLFGIVQDVLTPDWVWPHFMESPENTLAEFYELKQSDIQVVFAGTSHSLNAIDPMKIYEQTGIVTYNLSTSAQPIELSYHMLVECFKKQNPKYVFLDAERLTSAFEKDAYYRYVLDAMPISANKLDLAMDYLRLFSEDKRVGALLGSFFPLYRYHDRWTELRDYDFNLIKPERDYFLKGSYLNTKMVAATRSVETVNDIAKISSSVGGWVEEIEKGKIVQSTSDEMVFAPKIDQNAVETLLEIKSLCENNGAQLWLTKIPTCVAPQSRGTWTEIQYNLVKDVSKNLQIPYIDLLYDLDEDTIGLDWSTDTADKGGHLNYKGTQKISDWFANFLNDVCCVEGHFDAEYEKDLSTYHTACTIAELQMIPDLTTYLKSVSDLEDVTVFFSAMDDMMSKLSEENREDLKAFGLQTNFDKLVYSDSYLAIKEDSTVLYEASGNRSLKRSGELKNGMTFSVTSCGWRAGSASNILINGVEYSMKKRGINIVVLDNRSGLVLDSVVFDTHSSSSQDGVRNSTSSTKKYSPMGSTVEQAYFLNYINYLLEKDI